MNISFTSQHGEPVLTKAHQAAEIASRIIKENTPISEADSIEIKGQLGNANLGADIFKSYTPEEDDSCQAHAELTDKAVARMPKISGSNLVEQLKTTLGELKTALTEAISKNSDNLDGEDRTIACMTKGTLQNIHSKMYG